MADAWVEEIYKEADLLSKLKLIADLCYAGDEIPAFEEWNGMIGDIKEICIKHYGKEYESGSFWQAFKGAARNCKDLILFADYIKLKLIPEVEACIAEYGSIDEREEGYRILMTTSGFFTVILEEQNYPCHSMVEPMEDARRLAQSIYMPESNMYYILGAGLGYLPYQLYLVSNKSARFKIYETDPRMFEYAKMFGVLSRIPKDHMEIIEDTDILTFLKDMDADPQRCFIEEWAINSLPKHDRKGVEDLYLNYTVVRDVLEKELSINYWKNMKSNVCKRVDELTVDKTSKDYIVVAAGPSLDQTMDFIKENRDNMVVIAVGTVFRKLVKNNLIPDYLAVIESNELVYKQFEGLEDMTIPIVMPMCAYWKIAEQYKGPIYVFPVVSCTECVEYAKEHDEQLWIAGGTVSYTAINLAVKLGAERIFLAGLDLAYPDSLSHATDTPQREEKDVSDMELVPKVGGGKVRSDLTFSIYRHAIEELIKSHKNVKFYNLSKEGSRIKGTIEGYLK